MSVENIVNINESNLQQVLEQSMTTPVLFYFWSERSQHCLQLTPILENACGAVQRAIYSGEAGLRRGADDCRPVWSARDSDRVSVPERATGRWLPGPQPEEAIRALLDKVLPREEELKAQQAMQLMQEGNYTDALPLLKDAWQLSNQNGRSACCWQKR